MLLIPRIGTSRISRRVNPSLASEGGCSGTGDQHLGTGENKSSPQDWWARAHDVLPLCLTHATVSLEPSGKALLLTTSTEVSIAPKLHTRQNGSAGSVTNGKPGKKKARGTTGVDASGTPTTETIASSATGETAKLSSCVLRVLPSRFSLLPPEETDTVFAYVSRATLVAQCRAKETTPWRVRVRKLPPPTDPSQEQASGAPILPPVPRVLIPNGETSGDSQPAEEAHNELILAWSPDVAIPDGHIILSGKIETIENWDVVRCGLSYWEVNLSVIDTDARVTFVEQDAVIIPAGDPNTRPHSRMYVREFTIQTAMHHSQANQTNKTRSRWRPQRSRQGRQILSN